MSAIRRSPVADALMNFMQGAGLPVTILVCGAIVVIVEAAEASRRVLWGDFFADDLDD